MINLKDWPDNPFWDFSIEHYSRDGVATHLILLQEELEADVNIILYCCWCAYIGAPLLTRSQLKRGLLLVTNWQREIVIPLRRLRTKMRTDQFSNSPLSQNVREEIKKAELEAECLEQLMLYQNHLPKVAERNLDDGKKRALAGSNIALYFDCISQRLGPQEHKLIDHLLMEFFS